MSECVVYLRCTGVPHYTEAESGHHVSHSCFISLSPRLTAESHSHHAIREGMALCYWQASGIYPLFHDQAKYVHTL